jgi:glycosyltransferase involved in cell wall biosynthesis
VTRVTGGPTKPIISVVTTTFDRAATLPRLYDSLEAQLPVDFEWIVVDDGSTDGTAELVAGWARSAPFPITYVHQENSGKPRAINAGVAAARGEFCAVMDDDDWYLPGALARMLARWEEIPAPYRERFANIEGLCADADGTVIGDRFPAETFDSTTIEIGLVHGISGDTVGMYRREVLAANPFPEDLGRHVTEALVWNRIGARWWTRYVDEVWAGKEYRPDGLTRSKSSSALPWPESGRLFWQELAAMPRPIPLAWRYKASANAIRYGLACGDDLKDAVALAPGRGWAAAALPVALALRLRDRRRDRSAGGEG